MATEQRKETKDLVGGREAFRDDAFGDVFSRGHVKSRFARGETKRKGGEVERRLSPPKEIICSSGEKGNAEAGLDSINQLSERVISSPYSVTTRSWCCLGETAHTLETR